MSQADYHPDSASSSASSSSAVPPSDVRSVVPPPGQVVPAQQIPPPPPPIGKVSRGSVDAAKPPSPVPPPPPPRSTLPPLRPAPDPSTVIGVGSAKGVRWRDELNDLGKASKKSPGATSDGSVASTREVPDQEEEPGSEERNLSREAPPWLVSMVIHLVLLLILALISSPVGTGIGRVMLTIGESERQSPSELTEFSIATDVALADSDAMQESEMEVEIPTIFDTSQLSDPVDVAPIDLGVGSEIAMSKPMFNGRTGAMKQALLAIYGGTPKTQDAVARGLAWLKRNQHKSGYWSMLGPYRDGGVSENKTAATAMALLAFLGDGHTHLGGEYAKEVEAGMKFLVKNQDRSGFFAKNSRGHEKMYAQAQASIAICELYAMTKDSWLRPRAQLALDYAMKAQSPEGGWRYEPNFDSDTSVTGWFVMALQSGRAAGLEVDISVLTKVDKYLDTASSFDDAAYGYQGRSSPSPAMTAEGILCRQYISWKRGHPPMARGVRALLSDSPFSLNDRDVYYWYYATQVMHHYGESPWREWNDKMRVGLPKIQITGGREDGSWAPQQDRWGRNSGRLYTTCFSIYCLEVYYRHMPLYKANTQ